MSISTRALFSVLWACTLVACCAWPSLAAADERERIFLAFDGDVEALEKDVARFQGPVLEHGELEFAGTQEMEALYADCGEDIGVDAATRRDCQLRAANRIMVTQVLQLRGDEVDKKTWDVVLEVWSPETNGMLWVASEEVEARSLRLAAREAYPRLAAGYLCWRGVESACAEDPAEELAGTLTADTDRAQVPAADTTPTDDAAPPTTSGTLSKSELVAVVRRSAGKVRRCAEAANVTGTVKIKFQVEPDGSVSSAQALGDHADTTLGNCVAGVVRQLRLSAFTGEPVSVVYPFRLE